MANAPPFDASVTRAPAASFRMLADRLPDGLFVHGRGGFLYANGRFCDLVGRDARELGRLTLANLVPPHVLPSVRALLDRAAAGSTEEPAFDCPLQRADGNIVGAELRAFPMNFNGEPAVACVVRDLSERHALQTRLMLADRLASVGTLAAGVAHEINNPLAFVVINLAYVSEQLERFSSEAPKEILKDLQLAEIQDAIGEAQEGSQRVRRIVHELRMFARADEERRESVHLSQVLDACVSMAWNEIRHRARLERDFEPDLPTIDASPGRIAQVFLNLILNAAQAIKPGDAESNQIRLTIRRHGPDAVRVLVSDSGHGIPPEDLPRIFDPFFTTKPVGVGTGLGLSICHSTVTAMGGHLAVESTPGRGTTCTVELPLRRDRVVETTPPPSASPPIRRGRVLVVDDEPSVGTSLRRALRPHHDVDYSVSARAGLERLAESQTGYDVILCDLMMPDMSGMEFYEAIQRDAPELSERLVFFTGGAFVPATQEFLDSIPNRRVEKPLDLNQVKNLIQEMVAAQTPSPGLR